MRALLATIAGFLAAFVVVAVVETAGALVFPPTAAGAPVPAGAMLFVLVAWLLAPLLGCGLAAFLGRGRAAAVIVGALFVAACLANLVAIPSPWWLWAGGLLAAPAMGALGARLAERARAARDGRVA